MPASCNDDDLIICDKKNIISIVWHEHCHLILSLKALRAYIFAVNYLDSLYWNFFWLILFVSCSFSKNCVGDYFVWLFSPYYLISQLSFSEDSYCFLRRFETKRPFLLLLSIFCCCLRWLNVVNDIILPITLSFTRSMRVLRVKYD